MGISSSQLTNSIIFQRGRLNHQPVMNVPSKPQLKDPIATRTGKVGRIKKEGCDTAAGGVSRCPRWVVSHGGTGDHITTLEQLGQSHPKAGRKRWKSWKVTPSADLGWSQIPGGNLLISQPQEKPCKKRGKWSSLPNLTPRAEVPGMVWFITWRTTIWQSWLNLHPTRRNHNPPNIYIYIYIYTHT